MPRISELPSASNVTGEDLLVSVDAGTTKRLNADQVLAFVQANTDLNDLNDVAAGSPTSGHVLSWSGSAWVSSAISLTLDNLTDVNTSGVDEDDVLTYQAGTWVPAPSGGFTLALDDLTDVNTTGVATGDFLQWNGAAWVDRTFVFDDISDVNLSGAADGDFLQRQSGVWVDRTLLFDDISDVNLSGANNGDFLQRQSGVWVDRTFVFDDISDVDLTSANNGDFLQRQSGVWVDRTLVFDDISDVDLTGAADGDFLRRTGGVWVDHDLVISDATDVDTSGAADGEVLTYDSGQWISQMPTGGITELDDIPDVDTTGVSDGDVLTFDLSSGDWIAAAPSGGSSPNKRVVLNRTNYQSISDDTLTTITWTNEIEDDEGWHATNSSDVVVPAGVYLVTLNWGWYDDDGLGANGTGTRFHHIEVDNGVDTRVIAAIAANPTTSFDDCTGNMVIPYVAEDECTFRVRVYQDSGGTRAFGGAPRPLTSANLSSNTEFSIVQLMAGAGSGGSPATSSAYWDRLGATLEPLAIEPQNWGTFTYSVGPSESKLLMSAWHCQYDTASGRLDMRDSRNPGMPFLPLVDCDVIGASSQSTAWVIDPSLASYSDAMTTYYDRLEWIATHKSRKRDLDAADTWFSLIPGPYGAIITSAVGFNMTWLAITGPIGASSGFPFTEEIGDDGTDEYFRYGRAMTMAVSKNVMAGVLTGQGGGDGTPNGVLTYILLEDDWGMVADPNTYTFRDDFMGATLDTSTKWTRAQATGGNVEIYEPFASLQIIGDGNWGTNGCHSQTSVSKQSGRVFLMDFLANDGAVFVIGSHDGGGESFSDFAHGILISSWLGGEADINAFENGNNRGVVGSGVTDRALYRLRITLGSGDAAVWEIQGGPEYDQFGGASWTDITPGTTSSSTSPQCIGATIHTGFVHLSDARMYG